MEAVAASVTSSGCPICVEEKPLISCKFCQYQTCLECIKTYITGSLFDPHCMNCRTRWEYPYLIDMLGIKFITEKYQPNRRHQLLELEKTRLGEAQPLATIINTLVQNKTVTYQGTTFYLRSELPVQNSLRFPVLRDILTHMIPCRQRRYNMEYFDVYDNERNIYQQTMSVPKTTFRCQSDGCKGVLDEQFFCSLCQKTSCHLCFETVPQGTAHICKAENLASAKVIKESYVRCPKCNVWISKISGCNQMFCTMCHTAFDYGTGEVINGVIHNPHYMEYQRQMRHGGMEGGGAGVPGCQNLPEAPALMCLMNALRRCREVQFKLAHHRNYLVELEGEKRLYRTLYLLDVISEKKWSSLLFRKDRREEYEIELNQIREMFVMASGDLFRELEGSVEGMYDRYFNFCTSLLKLVEYFNTQVQNLRKTFGYVPVTKTHEDLIPPRILMWNGSLYGTVQEITGALIVAGESKGVVPETSTDLVIRFLTKLQLVLKEDGHSLATIRKCDLLVKALMSG